jgi:hypothetical protein
MLIKKLSIITFFIIVSLANASIHSAYLNQFTESKQPSAFSSMTNWSTQPQTLFVKENTKFEVTKQLLGSDVESQLFSIFNDVVSSVYPSWKAWNQEDVSSLLVFFKKFESGTIYDINYRLKNSDVQLSMTFSL